MQRTVSKKPIIILGSLLSLLVIVTVFYILSLSKNKDLQLEQLRLKLLMKILDIRRNKKEKTYAIDIQGKLSYADNDLIIK